MIVYCNSRSFSEVSSLLPPAIETGCENLVHLAMDRPDLGVGSHEGTAWLPTRGAGQVEVSVYEGERPCVDQNRLLGEFEITNIEQAKKGVPQVEVSFALDTNGVLQVRRSPGVERLAPRRTDQAYCQIIERRSTPPHLQSTQAGKPRQSHAPPCPLLMFLGQ